MLQIVLVPEPSQILSRLMLQWFSHQKFIILKAYMIFLKRFEYIFLENERKYKISYINKEMRI